VRRASKAGIRLTDDLSASLTAYYELLARWNRNDRGTLDGTCEVKVTKLAAERGEFDEGTFSAHFVEKVDYPRKLAGLGPLFVPTGDVDADMAEIKRFYAPFKGRNSDQFTHE